MKIDQVRKKARESTIRAAFKHVAAMYHPDKAGGMYKEIVDIERQIT